MAWHPEAGGGGFWVVTSYRHVAAVNRDWRRFSNEKGISPEGHGAEQDLVLLDMDPPRQTRYRALVSPSFRPRAVAHLEPRVREIAREMVAGFARAGGGDFVELVAAPFPVRVIAELMGARPQDEPDIHRWANAVVPSQDPEYWISPEAAARASAELDAYNGELLARKRARPGDDLASRLLEARLDGEPLSEADLRSFVRLILVGGAETTRHLLSNAMHSFLEHPGERDRLVSGAAPVKTAVEEMLRYHAPVMHHARWATADVEIAGAKIRAGDRVTLWMTAANRDESAFPEPDRLDLGRRPNYHTSLGAGGPHFCLGAHLVRLEARVLFEELRELLPRLRAGGEPRRLRSNFFNGIKNLQVTLDA